MQHRKEKGGRTTVVYPDEGQKTAELVGSSTDPRRHFRWGENSGGCSWAKDSRKELQERGSASKTYEVFEVALDNSLVGGSARRRAATTRRPRTTYSNAGDPTT